LDFVFIICVIFHAFGKFLSIKSSNSRYGNGLLPGSFQLLYILISKNMNKILTSTFFAF